MTQPTELRAALIAAFPPTPITHGSIHTADARWTEYERRDELAQLEGKAWTELDAKTLERHDALLTHAGGALYRAVVPAYLLLLAEGAYYTTLPFHVAGELMRREGSATDQKIFDERVGPMSAEQRAVVRSAIAFLAGRDPMQKAMTAALRSW